MRERSSDWNLALRCLLVCAISVAAAVVLVAPLPLDEPVSWGGDTLEHAILVDSANWLGEPGFSQETGAPYGVDWSVAPSGGERLNIAVISILAGASGSIWSGINLHMLLAIAATALAAFLVLRWMGTADLLAGAGALAFALGSAVYDHIEQGHLFLFALYPVPLAVYLALRWSGWSPQTDAGAGQGPTRASRSTLLVSSGCVLVIGLSSTYYSLFAVLTIGLLAVLVALRNLDWRRAVPGVLCAGSIVMVVLLSSLGGLLSDAPRLERRLSDSIRFALDPLRVFLPQRESVTALTNWGASPADAIGLAATVGVLWLSGVLLRNLGRKKGSPDGLLLRLFALLGISLAIGVPGGIGWLIARVGAQELRAWSRISVFITFVGLAALVVLSGRAAFGHARQVRPGERPSSVAPRFVALGTVAVLLVALIEQRSLLPDGRAVAERLSRVEAVVAQMEEVLPAGSDVLVLPAGSYLNDFGPGQALALPLLGDTLRYSAGSFRGGSGDWQHTLALEPLATQMQVAAAGGFEAVVIDSEHHLLGDPEGTIDTLEDLLGPPAGSVGPWIWWELEPLESEVSALGEPVAKLREVALRPLGVTVEGTPGFPSASAERDALIGANGSITIRDHSGGDESVVVAFDVTTAPGAELELAPTGGPTGTVETIAGTGEPTSVTVEVDITDGIGSVEMVVDGDPYRRGDDDPDAFALLQGIQAFDARMADAGVAVPEALR
ncbi:MAG: hypothetical protein ACR2OH_07295 [Microthrixaceae bacterium]